LFEAQNSARYFLFIFLVSINQPIMEPTSSPSQLSSADKKQLRGLGQRLKPQVFVGRSGWTEAVSESMESAFKNHELVKVRFSQIKERDVKAELMVKLAESTQSECVGSVGHTALFFRRRVEG